MFATFLTQNLNVSNIVYKFDDQKIFIVDSSEILFSNACFKNITSEGKYLVEITRTKVIQIRDSAFLEYNKDFFNVMNSNMRILNSRF